jgi:nitroimidazol reductase NimA-like FMN-containing flavoprotein (pyridoxamine 5'-phosphate oxidase superfamily)
MRRAEKEVLECDEIEGIIGRATVCRLAMVDDGLPYVIPLNFGYRDGVLYFHSARQGRKMEILRRGGTVCFEIDTPLGLLTAPDACQWGMRYESVIGYGTPRFIDDPEEKVQALACIMAQYDDGEHTFPEAALEGTAVFALPIDSMTAKRSL